jgi:putative flippase GtrA
MPKARRLLSHARSPNSGLPGQGIRFAIAGGTVAAIYIAVTTTLADGLGAPFQIALVVGFGIAVVAHFTLQRMFVWVHHTEFALPVQRQAARYLLAAGAQYGVTAAATAFLPGALDVSVTLVYLCAVAVCSILSFLVFRLGVFHPEPGA